MKGAPGLSAYESQSGDVIDTMNDLLEKAQTQLQPIRATEIANIQNFEMLKQSLPDEIKFEGCSRPICVRAPER